jgi:hypothetical protein
MYYKVEELWTFSKGWCKLRVVILYYVLYITQSCPALGVNHIHKLRNRFIYLYFHVNDNLKEILMHNITFKCTILDL